MVADLWWIAVTALAAGKAIGKTLDEYYNPRKIDPDTWPHKTRRESQW